MEAQSQEVQLNRSSSPAGPFGEYTWLPRSLGIAGLALFAVMALNLVLGGPLLELDRTWGLGLMDFSRRAPGWFFQSMRVFAFLGQEAVILGGLILAVFSIRQRDWRSFWMLMLGVLGGFLLFLFVAFLFGRERPQYPGVPLSPLPTPSFPSGHVLSSIDYYGLLAYLQASRRSSRTHRLLLLLAALLLVLGIAASRLFLGRHFPTDVAAGFGLGLAWSALVYTGLDAYFYRRGARKE